VVMAFPNGLAGIYNQIVEKIKARKDSVADTSSSENDDEGNVKINPITSTVTK